MFGIALRFGVPLAALKTANPSVQPNFMGEGTTLLIPLTPTAPINPTPTPTPIPNATPTPASLQTDCYRDALGGIYCFVSYANKSDRPIENVTAVVSLKGITSEYERDQVAILPLNILPAETTLPLVTYFQPPTPQLFSASALPDFSLPVPSGDERYLEASITEHSIQLNAGKSSAVVNGVVSLSDPLKPAGSLWVLGVGYSADGRVIGFRRWEAALPIPLVQQIPFSFNLYSLGPEIDHVDLFVEARPVLP